MFSLYFFSHPPLLDRFLALLVRAKNLPSVVRVLIVRGRHALPMDPADGFKVGSRSRSIRSSGWPVIIGDRGRQVSDGQHGAAQFSRSSGFHEEGLLQYQHHVRVLVRTKALVF